MICEQDLLAIFLMSDVLRFPDQQGRYSSCVCGFQEASPIMHPEGSRDLIHLGGENHGSCPQGKITTQINVSFDRDILLSHLLKKGLTPNLHNLKQ